MKEQWEGAFHQVLYIFSDGEKGVGVERSCHSTPHAISTPMGYARSNGIDLLSEWSCVFHYGFHDLFYLFEYHANQGMAI